MQAEFFTTRPITIEIPIFQPLYALAALGVVIFVVAWLLTHRQNWRQWLSMLPRLHKHAGVNVVYYAAIILAVPWLPLTLLTLDGLFELWYSKPNPQGEGFTENTLRLHFLALAGLTTILAGLVGAPLALLRVHTVERQTTAQEEGLITERINKAVASLGADKTRKKSATSSEGESRSLEETLPNLEVRIGAIYALERIAQDSLRDHIQIMEILCAYIRQNAPASEAPELPQPPAWFEGEDPLSDDSWKVQFGAWKRQHREALQNVKPRGDIQTALTVIGRRSDKQKAKEWGNDESYAAFQNGPPAFPTSEADGGGVRAQSWKDAVQSWQKAFDDWTQLKPAYRLDLRETNLRKADLSGVSQKADFSHGRFDRADLQGVDFGRANAQGADFGHANAQGADFGHANAQGADFWRANAQGANFSLAKAQGTDFSDAQAQGANLSNASVQCGSFVSAHMQNAHFKSTRLNGADFRFADLHSAGFNGANISRASFKDAYLRKVSFFGTNAQGADFENARVQGAVFQLAEAQGAVFTNAKTHAVDFSDALFDENTNFSGTELLSAALRSDISNLGLTQEQVNAAFGDGFTAGHLPEGLTKPDHWPDWKLDYAKFDDEWHKWQREGTAYVPPPKPVE